MDQDVLINTNSEHITLEKSNHNIINHNHDISNTSDYDDDVEIMGLDINEYSNKYNISPQQVWKDIKTGKLVARSERGKIFVYGNSIPEYNNDTNIIQTNNHVNTHNNVQNFMYTSENDIQRLNLPPLNNLFTDFNTSITTQTNSKNNNTMSLPIKIFTEHLNLAKDQQKNLIQLTQNYINTLTQMTEKIISLKDQHINEQSQKINLQQKENEQLQSTITQLEKENSILKQKIEDLEILTKMIEV